MEGLHGEMKAADNHNVVLRIFFWGGASDEILNFAKIAACMGVRSELVNLALWNSLTEDIRSSALAGASVWDIDSLSSLIDTEAWSALGDLLPEGSANVLILTRGCSGSTDDILKILTGGKLRGTRSAGRPEGARFPTNSGRWSTQLSGFGYGRSGREASVLDAAKDCGIQSIMDYGGDSPAFAVLPAGLSQLFVWTTLAVFDMDQPLGRELEFEQALDEFIPAIIFLRHAFGDRCWTYPCMGADIVIDDPILEKKYGCIDFPRLLRVAQEMQLHVTVAFIPWNYWRTRRKDIQVFLSYKELFDICAHGCDHVSREFRSKDYGELLARTHLGADRMDRHRDRTGMAWDHFMVVPREDYTVEAIRALADSGRFLGMANSGCIPRDMDSKMVRGSDLMLPVQDAFFGFPIFKRQYWKDMSVFGMLAFLGKPAILCEHHAFFGDDCRGVEQFAAQLKALCPGVQWSNLSTLARRVHQRKRAGVGEWDIRFFTDQFEIENRDAKEGLHRFQRRLPPEVSVKGVSINGIGISFSRNGEVISFEAPIKTGQTAKVQVERAAVTAQRPLARSWAYQARVATRRLFSEIRDQSGCKSAR